MFIGSQESPSASEGLTSSDIDHRVPSVTVAYSRKRISEETNPIFEKIDSYPKGGTYIPDVVPRAGRGTDLANFIAGNEEEGPEIATSSFGAEFATSSIMSSLTMRTLMRSMESPSSCTPTLPGEHYKANNPPKGYFTFSHLIMRAGAHLPLRSYFIDVLEYLGLLHFSSPQRLCHLDCLVHHNQMGFPSAHTT